MTVLDRKAFGVVDFDVKSVTDDPEDPVGSFYAVLSSPSTDRDGEVVDAKAFDPLPASITIDTDHSLTIGSVVGSGTPVYEGDDLTVKGTYSSIDRAQEVRTLVREGHVKAMSVTFINGKREKDQKGLTHVRAAELVNATFCVAGINRDALVLAAKSVKAGRRNSATDTEHLQSAHDHLVSAGADCAAGKALNAARAARKAVVGSYEDRQEDIVEALVEANTAALAAAYPETGPGSYGYLVRLVATFDDRAVYQIGWDDDSAWQVDYTWDGETVTLGSAVEVSVDQVVTPAADAPEGAAAAAAKAAAASDAQAGEEMALRARALHLVAQAAT